jgi:hypothetical protein
LTMSDRAARIWMDLVDAECRAVATRLRQVRTIYQPGQQLTDPISEQLSRIDDAYRQALKQARAAAQEKAMSLDPCARLICFEPPQLILAEENGGTGIASNPEIPARGLTSLRAWAAYVATDMAAAVKRAVQRESETAAKQLTEAAACLRNYGYACSDLIAMWCTQLDRCRVDETGSWRRDVARADTVFAAAQENARKLYLARDVPLTDTSMIQLKYLAGGSAMMAIDAKIKKVCTCPGTVFIRADLATLLEVIEAQTQEVESRVLQVRRQKKHSSRDPVCMT